MANVSATVTISDDFDDETSTPNFFDGLRVEQNEGVKPYRCARCRVGLTPYYGANDVIAYEAENGSTLCPEYENEDEDGNRDYSHEAERVPLSWWNGSRVEMNEEDDEVMVTISADDPRGAFSMTVRRIPDTSDGPYAGRLILGLPYEGMGWAHMFMTEIHQGTYLLSSSPTTDDAKHRTTDITKLLNAASEDEANTIRRLADRLGLKY